MTWWTRLKAWAIVRLGGHLEAREPEPKRFIFPQLQHEFLPLDRPFDLMDWERLSTLPNREPLLMEWLGHRIRDLDKRASTLKYGPECDRERLVLDVRRDELMRSLHMGTEAGNKVAEIWRKRELADRAGQPKEGMANYGR